MSEELTAAPTAPAAAAPAAQGDACPQCGGENRAGATKCYWCAHVFGTPIRPRPTAVVIQRTPPEGLLAQFAQSVSVLLWIGVMFACGIAGLAFLASQSAPQQAAALAWAVIPYCFARAWDGMRGA